MNEKTWLKIGIILSLLGVVLGAFGAHALKDILSPYGKEVYQKGIFYHFVHAIAMINIFLLWKNGLIKSLDKICLCFVCGIILFSGSLYCLGITEIKYLGMITPFGGVLFMLGWVFTFIDISKS